MIRGPFQVDSFTLTLHNVKVVPHNLRSYVYRKGIVTALDVILSLVDQGKITYELM
jgi:hypothetical protein